MSDTALLDLDAIERRYKQGDVYAHVPALIAESRRLRKAMMEAAAECGPSSYSKADIRQILCEALGLEA